MIFTSIVFALFFLIVAILFYLVPGKYQWIWLLVSSIFFYVYSIPAYIIVAAFIIVITYYAGIKIEKATTQKKATHFYLAALILNISILVFFKYTNFFTSIVFDSINFVHLVLFPAV